MGVCILRAGIIMSVCLIALVCSGNAALAIDPDARVVFGVRASAQPFSYCAADRAECSDGNCASGTGLDSCPFIDGFTVRICQKVRERIAREAPGVSFAYRVVDTDPDSPTERFRMLQTGEIAILCGASTVTLERMRAASASLFVFLSGASAVHRRSVQLDSAASLKGLRAGVLAGTTTLSLLRDLNRGLEGEDRIDIRVFPSHEAARSCLTEQAATRKTSLPAPCADGLDAYFADREILSWMVGHYAMPDGFVLSNRFFSSEPYAIFVAQDRPDLLYEVNATLVSLFKDQDALREIMKMSFGTTTRSETLDTLFAIQRLPVR